MNLSSRTQKSFFNLITGIGGQMIAVVLRFISRTIFIYTLGKSYLGINGLFSDILSMLSLAELGFDTAINFKLYKPLAENDTRRVRMLMKFYRQAYTVVGIVILLFGLCMIPFLHLLIKDYDSLAALGIDATEIFLLYLFQSVSTYLFLAYRSAVIKADQKQYILNVADYLVTIITNLVQIAILLVWHNFVLYTAVAILFNILKNIINAVIAGHMYPEVFEKEPDSISKAEIKDLFKDCMALLVYKVNWVVLKATDNIVLSMFIGLSVVGIYSNYLMIYSVINNLLDWFYSATKASMGNLYAVSDVSKQYRFFRIINYITFLIYGTVCVGVAVVADELLNCWIGSDYVIAQPLAILIGIEILFHGLKTNLGQVRNISGVFRQAWFCPALGILINLGVSIALVQKCGIYGVIIGTICADIGANFMVDPAVIYKHSFHNYRPVSDYYKQNSGYFVLLAAVGAADMFLCKAILPGHGWISVTVHILICSCSVPGMFLLVYRNTAECKYLKTILKRRRQ
jgi:O-antigen/teichoic acid export membrane protein